MPPNPSIDEKPAVKILLAEDDKTTGFLLTRALQEYGYRVECTNDGQQCLDKFLGLQPDIVLLDGMMPVMDGFTCCQRLRNLPTGADLPILIITYLDDQASIDKAFQAGATDYITKPVHWSSLRRRIEHLISRQNLVQRVNVLETALDEQQSWYALWSQSLSLLTRFAPNNATLRSLLEQFNQVLNVGQLLLIEQASQNVVIVNNQDAPLPPELLALPLSDYGQLLQHSWPALVSLDCHYQDKSTKKNIAALLGDYPVDLLLQPLLFQGENLGILLAQHPRQADGWPEPLKQRLRDLGSLLSIFMQKSGV